MLVSRAEVRIRDSDCDMRVPIGIAPVGLRLGIVPVGCRLGLGALICQPEFMEHFCRHICGRLKLRTFQLEVQQV